ncbi:MAG: tetratricopeptide repeat protein [Chthonomonadales bacterium]
MQSKFSKLFYLITVFVLVVGSITVARADELSDLIDNGKAAIDQKKFLVAISYLEKATKKYPGSIPAHSFLALAYSHVGKNDSAIQQIEKVISLDPQSPAGYKAEGLTYVELKNFDNALRNFLAASKLDPDDAEVWLNIGYIYFTREKYSDALVPMENSTRLNPQYYINHYYLARVYDELKRPTDALREVQSAINLNPKSADSYVLLGWLYRDLKRYSESVTALRKANALSPKDLDVTKRFAKSLLLAEKYQEALPIYARLAILNPEDQSVWANYGFALIRIGQSLADNPSSKVYFLKAKDILAQAYKRFKNDAEIVAMYGEALYDVGRTSDAIFVLKRATHLNPAESRTHFVLGMAYFTIGRKLDAIKSFKRELAIIPDDKQSLQELAWLQSNTNQFAEAVKTYTRITQLPGVTPSDLTSKSLAEESAGDKVASIKTIEDAHRQFTTTRDSAIIRAALGEIYYVRATRDGHLDLNLLKDAEKEYQAALSLFPNESRAIFGMGDVRRDQKRYDEAVAYFTRLVAFKEETSNAYRNIGFTFEKKGDKAKAMSYYKKALQIDPHNEKALKNLKSLQK